MYWGGLVLFATAIIGNCVVCHTRISAQESREKYFLYKKQRYK